MVKFVGVLAKIALSSGSVCNSATVAPSYVLKALGRSDALAHAACALAAFLKYGRAGGCRRGGSGARGAVAAPLVPSAPEKAAYNPRVQNFPTLFGVHSWP